MKRNSPFLASLCLLGLPLLGLPLETRAQSFDLQVQTLPNPNNEPAPVHPIPHPRQLKWQETEFYAFFHYGMNTYTNKEWGYGDEDESTFAPTRKPKPRQWLKAAKAAGMRGGIAVVKHHDGFCLWPTATTEHNCTRSANSNARKTNIPKDFAQAARSLGLKYGFYISPWDRNSALYGTDRYVKEVFLKQSEELARYGSDQFEMWFDGANGGDGYYGGRNTTVNVGDATVYYDVPNLRDAIHRICPDCVLWGVGGEARWIGNEAGWAGERNWSTENRGYVPERNGMYGTEGGWFWLPGESDAKATNQGWFWHEGETPLSGERLFQMYLETVGRNATLILNLPPDRSGRLPQATVRNLKEMGELIRTRLGKDLAQTAQVQASEVRTPGPGRSYGADRLTDGDKNTYWAPQDGTEQAVLTFTWDRPQTLRYVELMEHIALGQRIKRFRIETSLDGEHWTPRGGSIDMATVGYKRIIPLHGATDRYDAQGLQAKALRIVIEESLACPLLQKAAIY